MEPESRRPIRIGQRDSFGRFGSGAEQPGFQNRIRSIPLCWQVPLVFLSFKNNGTQLLNIWLRVSSPRYLPTQKTFHPVSLSRDLCPHVKVFSSPHLSLFCIFSHNTPFLTSREVFFIFNQHTTKHRAPVIHMLRLFLVFSLLCTTAWTMIIFFPPPLYVKLNPGTKPYTGRVSSDCGGVSKQLLPNDLINIANKSIFLAIPWELAQDPPLSIVLGTNYGNFFLVILLLLGEGWPSLFTLIFLILLSLNASVCECQYNIGQFLFWLN